MAKRQVSRAFNRFITSLEKWLDLLWLNDHERYVRMEADDSTIRGGDKVNFQVTASCHTQPRYKDMHITVQESFLADATDKEIDETACHELIHQVIAPLDDVARDLIDSLPASKREGWNNYRSYNVEFVTQHLQNVIRTLYKSPRGRE